MNTMELFCGTKSFSKVAKELGHKTFTIDIDKQFEPDLTKDILDLYEKDIPKNIDVLWASPPCTTFSVASIGKHWYEDGTPKTKEAEKGLVLLKSTVILIKELKPKYWFIENPRGMMRKFLPSYDRRTVTYCQYGDTRQKPTDIWTNCINWKPRPMCKPKASCHVSAPRGSRTGTQGIKGAILRGQIPRELFIEIFKSMECDFK